MFSLSQHLVLHSPVQEGMHKYPSEHANVVMLKFFFQVFFNVLRPSLRVQQKKWKINYNYNWWFLLANNATRKVHFVTKSCQVSSFSQSSFSYVITNFYQANINQQIICEFCNFTPGYAFLSFVLSILQQKKMLVFSLTFNPFLFVYMYTSVFVS